VSARGTGPTPFEPDDDETARLLRRALAKEADMVEPSDNGMSRIHERLEGDRSRRWVPWAAAVAAAAVVGLVVGGLLGFGREDGGQVAAPTTSSTPTPTTESTSAPSSPSATTGTSAAGTLEGVPVYWIGQSKASFHLYREFRSVPDAGGVVASAVAAMTRDKPLDPDYMTPWSPASRVEVSQQGDALMVDLSPDAFAQGTGSEVAALAVQQLVWTATAAAQTDGPVTITVDGKPYDAWGVVQVGEPMTRAPQVDVQAPTWILSPTEGATVPAGEVEFTGTGTAFEGTFLWEVRDANDAVVADGFTQGGSMGTFGEFTFTATLTPGTYTVEVYQPDESGGESPEGPRMFPDTKTFTVK
jgi:hypothetical protein